MTGLTDTQLVLLSAASQRDDGMISILDRLKGGVATKVGQKLIALGLAEERIAPRGGSLWRDDAGAGRIGLYITRRGLTAIGVVEADDAFAAEAEGTTGGAQNNQQELQRDAEDAGPPRCLPLALPLPAGTFAPSNAAAASHDAIRAVRPGTKKAMVIGLLQRMDGACLDEILAATGWQPHTTRAVLTGLRKDGMSIAKVRQAGCVNRYRIIRAEPEESRGVADATDFDQRDTADQGELTDQGDMA